MVLHAAKRILSSQRYEKLVNGFKRSKNDLIAMELDFLDYDQPYHDVPRDNHYMRALRVTEKLFRPSRRLKPISFPDLRNYPWTLPVSAEFPFTSDPVWKATVNRKFEFKIRAVFGVPKLLLMVENMFIWNIQKEYQNQKTQNPMLWGFEMMLGGWLKLANKVRQLKPEWYLSTDWSQFDKRAVHEVIDDIHKIWRSWFDFDQGYEPTSNYPHSTTSERRTQNLWDWMTHSIKHTPILGPSGNLYQWKWNGIASGFMQTQLLDSFYNCIVSLTCLSSLGIDIEHDRFKIYVQGDDSFICLPHVNLGFTFKKEEFLTAYRKESLRRFNSKLSDKKSILTCDLNESTVLSYSCNNGIAKRGDIELLTHLLYPERSRTLGGFAGACVGLAYASMGTSLDAYNICRDVFLFLVNELEQTPTFPGNWQKKLRAMNIELDPSHFPSFDEVFSQNFNIREQTDSLKQRL